MRTTLFALTAAGLLSTAAHAAPATYAIDPSHTFATFEIDHFGAATNRGRFDKKTGNIQFDKQAKTGKVEVNLDMKSVNTGVTAFDKHLKNVEIFNTDKFPEAKFVSDNFVFAGDKLKEVTGQLTLMGITKPITIKANKFNCYESPMLKAEVCGGDFEATIDRTQWGVNYGIDWGFPKEVRLVLSVEAVKQ